MVLHPQLLQFASLFDTLEDALVWVKDTHSRYCWVNRAFLINFTLQSSQGQARADARDVLGKSDYDLSPPFLADQFRLDDEYVLTGKRIVNRIEKVGQPDGLTVWNVTNKIPIFDHTGTVIGTAGITRRLEATGASPVLGPDSEFAPVLAHLRDHYCDPITNAQLARLAHMSVRAFERKFLSVFHLTPQRYLRRLQLQMASRALVYSRQSLAEVASRCGFADQSHFSRVFRQQFGRTPRDYRAHYASKTTTAASVPIPAVGEQDQVDGLTI